jgi:hypothetical protein
MTDNVCAVNGVFVAAAHLAQLPALVSDEELRLLDQLDDDPASWESQLPAHPASSSADHTRGPPGA